MQKISLELEYGDAAILEFCLIEFVENARRTVTELQNKEGSVYGPQRRELLKMYENRVRNGKRLLGMLSAELNTVEVGDE